MHEIFHNQKITLNTNKRKYFQRRKIEILKTKAETQMSNTNQNFVLTTLVKKFWLLTAQCLQLSTM